MKAYSVQMVGQPAKPVLAIEAHSAAHAVSEAARCDFCAVCLPIWRSNPTSKTGGNVASARYAQEYETECYMPLDNSGRQWLVREI
jgi:hypothetical protein